VRKTVANVVVDDALVRFVVFVSPGLWYNPVRGTPPTACKNNAR